MSTVFMGILFLVSLYDNGSCWEERVCQFPCSLRQLTQSVTSTGNVYTI